VLRDGALAQVGTPLDLYDNPDNLFVAGFIGSPKMNFLRAAVGPAGVTLPDHGNQIVPLPAGLSLAAGREVTIGLRPEHFTESGAGALAAEIELIERLGGETFAHARCGAKAMLTIKAGNDRSLRAGQAFTARFDPDCLLVFDGAGQRIR
jgi:lactose/L-arabinose transport system ATP-binding protein